MRDCKMWIPGRPKNEIALRMMVVVTANEPDTVSALSMIVSLFLFPHFRLCSFYLFLFLLDHSFTALFSLYLKLSLHQTFSSCSSANPPSLNKKQFIMSNRQQTAWKTYGGLLPNSAMIRVVEGNPPAAVEFSAINNMTPGTLKLSPPATQVQHTRK